MRSHYKNQIRRQNAPELEGVLLPHIGLDNVPPLTIEEVAENYNRLTEAGWDANKSMGRFVLDVLEREYEILKEDNKT
jgi:hypothetical protein